MNGYRTIHHILIKRENDDIPEEQGHAFMDGWKRALEKANKNAIRTTNPEDLRSLKRLARQLKKWHYRHQRRFRDVRSHNPMRQGIEVLAYTISCIASDGGDDEAFAVIDVLAGTCTLVPD